MCMRTGELLDEMARMLNCAYLSDLKIEVQRGGYALPAMLEGLVGFPLDAWEAAVSYITGKPRTFPDVDAAKQFLIAGKY